MHPKPFVYGTVCSGIGAPELAFRKRGWRCAFMSEIDLFPRAVLKHHYPTVPLHGDFTTINEGDYEPIDLLIGGTPCQSFSVAGLRKGLADDRGNLALEYILLADRLRPRWLAWENVPGVFSSRPGDEPEEDDEEPALLGHNGGPVLDERAPPGSDFAAFLSGLVRWEVPIPAGGWRNSGIVAPAPVDGAYGVAWGVLDAQHFGVPQRRRRVFVVGYLGDWRRPAAVLFERHSLQGHPAPRRGPREELTQALTTRFGNSGPDLPDAEGNWLVPGTVGALTSAHGPNGHGGSGLATDKGAEAGHILAWGPDQQNDVAFSLSSNKSGSGQFYDASVETFVTQEVADPLVAKEGEAYTHEGKNFRLRNVVPAFSFKPSHYTRDKDGAPSEITPPLSADADKGDQDPLICAPIAFTAKDYGADAAEDLSPTLRAGQFDGSHANGGVMPAVAFALRGRDEGAQPEVHEDGQSIGALRAASGGSSRDMVAATAVRRLTPTECERLQGFPDGFTQIAWRGAKAEDCPDGPRYKALGNSMAEPVIEWLGDRIALVEEIYGP